MSTHTPTSGYFPTLATRPNSRVMDLVFILDTICQEETLKERRRFIRGIIQEVAQELEAEGDLRVSIIPYGPHEKLRSGSSPDSLWIPLAPLTSDLSSIYRFLRKQVAQQGKGFEAAYEEALYTLHALEWDRTSHRVLVTVGHRPPRPCKPWSQRLGDPFDCYYQESCEKNLDWRFLLTGMRSGLRIHSVAVSCQSTWLTNSVLKYAERYTNYCWKEIGYTMFMRFSSNPAVPKQLARTLLKLV